MPSLLSKLVEIRKRVPYLQKDKKGYSYTYASGAIVIGALREAMDELGVLLVPSVIACESQDVVEFPDDARKRRRYSSARVSIRYRWMDSESNETLESEWHGHGFNDPDKAIGSAYTYAERYFLLKFFQIPTDDLDPDAYQRRALEHSSGDSESTPAKPAKPAKPARHKGKREAASEETIKELESLAKNDHFSGDQRDFLIKAIDGGLYQDDANAIIEKSTARLAKLVSESLQAKEDANA